MMLGSSRTQVEIYSATPSAVDGEFEKGIQLTKVHKPRLITVKNANYVALLRKYNHHKGVSIDDPDDRPQIPIHVVLGASEYASIMTTTAQKVGKLGQPVAKRTH